MWLSEQLEGQKSDERWRTRNVSPTTQLGDAPDDLISKNAPRQVVPVICCSRKSAGLIDQCLPPPNASVTLTLVAHAGFGVTPHQFRYRRMREVIIKRTIDPIPFIVPRPSTRTRDLIKNLGNIIWWATDKRRAGVNSRDYTTIQDRIPLYGYRYSSNDTNGKKTCTRLRQRDG